MAGARSTTRPVAIKRIDLKANPRIEITPSATQYRRLYRDLAVLRAAGATSNTAAIVEAVHDAAMRSMLGGDDRRRPGDAETPPARQQEVES
jgi:hypothetical protein